MRNSDMPAMPIGEQMDAMHLKPVCNGLTKREHFAAMAVPPAQLLEKALNQQTKGAFSLESYISAVANYKVREADALLAALEQNND